MEILKIEILKSDMDLFESCLAESNCKIADINSKGDFIGEELFVYDIQTESVFNFYILGRVYGQKKKQVSDAIGQVNKALIAFNEVINKLKKE